MDKVQSDTFTACMIIPKSDTGLVLSSVPFIRRKIHSEDEFRRVSICAGRYISGAYVYPYPKEDEPVKVVEFERVRRTDAYTLRLTIHTYNANGLYCEDIYTAWYESLPNIGCNILNDGILDKIHDYAIYAWKRWVTEDYNSFDFDRLMADFVEYFYTTAKKLIVIKCPGGFMHNMNTDTYQSDAELAELRKSIERDGEDTE